MTKSPGRLMSERAFRRPLSQFLNHAMHVCGGALNVEVLVLSCPALRGKHCASVNLLEVTVRKFIPSFGVFVRLVVDSQKPLSILREPLCVDEVVFLPSGGLVFAPRVPVVDNDSSFADEFFRAFEPSSCSVPLPYSSYYRTTLAP